MSLEVLYHLKQFKHLELMALCFQGCCYPCPGCDTYYFPDEDICTKCELDLSSVKTLMYRLLLQDFRRAADEYHQVNMGHVRTIDTWWHVLAPEDNEETEEHLYGAGIYIIYGGMRRFKIGLSVDVPARLRELECGSPEALLVIHIIRTDNLNWCERFLHQRFRAKHLKGEWFRLDFEDLVWLTSTKRLDEPKTISAQQRVLDFLERLDAH